MPELFNSIIPRLQKITCFIWMIGFLPFTYASRESLYSNDYFLWMMHITLLRMLEFCRSVISRILKIACFILMIGCLLFAHARVISYDRLAKIIRFLRMWNDLLRSTIFPKMRILCAEYNFPAHCAFSAISLPNCLTN